MVQGDSDTLPLTSSNGVTASARLTITIPYAVFACLEKRSVAEGRSLSKLAAHLIECALRGSANDPEAVMK